MMRRPLFLLVCVGMVLGTTIETPARGSGSKQPTQDSRCNDVPAHPFDLILGRPTLNSITASVLCYEDTQGYLAYGTQPGKLARRTSTQVCKAGEPEEIVLSTLEPNTQYFYQFQGDRADSEVFSFRTPRPPGSTFTVTVIADSHLDENTDCALYQQTLANAHADAPDFHVDLGDTFMTEKYASRTEALRQYLAQRFYFSQVCASASLFLVLGNHDGESPRGPGNDADSLAVWSNLTRKRYFPNPVPDNFYTGNATPHLQAGPLQDYYAWEWGDALFVVLDPFWFAQKPRSAADDWKCTLGGEQYQWLKRTLESSPARFKFVFIHNLVGGTDPQGRGGAEATPFYEWGGHNADGSDGFMQNRPGWPAPIHQLLLQNKVDIVFHGHDHLFAKQDLDGIVYQEVPQPGHPGGDAAPRSAAEYSYVSGTILGGSGHLRVAVAPAQATVAFVRTDGTVAHRYAVKPGDAKTPAEEAP
jgi:predicted phosphodiesterase